MKGNQKLQGMFALALVFGMAIAPGTTSQVRASSDNRIPVVEFNPPSRGAPPQTTEGGSRGCNYEQGEKSLMALAPTGSLALTVQKHPTFFWHIPESYAGQTLEFALMDAKDEQELYREYFSVPQAPGIASLKLPDTVEPLKEDKMYHWYLVVVCDPADRTGDIVIDGWIERVQPDRSLVANIEKASEQERPSIYGKAGIWQETIASLAKLRLENPSDSNVIARWEDLLSSVELGELAPYPLIPVRQTEAQANQALSY